MRLGDEGGAIKSGSLKQKLNTGSSTKADMIAVNDFMSKLLWTRNFLDGQQFAYGHCPFLSRQFFSNCPPEQGIQCHREKNGSYKY